jgi:pimeloyl-ACP methyl ester carboxylesterase
MSIFKYLYILIILNSISVFSQVEIPYGDNPKVGKYVQINDIKMYFEIYGKGEPLLLIHGNKTGIKGWKPQIESFKKKFKVIAIDCRGRGKSELGKDSLSYLQQAKDISQFIEKMKLDSVNIVGKSDGGIIGILLGIHYPKHIKKIVSFGANMQPDSTALYTETINEIKAERIHAEKMLAKKDTTQNWKVEYFRNRMMEFQPHISAEDLHKIQVPVLVMSCDRDVIKEEHTFFIYKNIPNSNLSIFPGEVHAVTRKNPELFNSTVIKFLKEDFKNTEIRFK